MKKREIQIINFLSKRKDWSTATAIAVDLGCTSRSVKTYIQDINDQYDNMIISSRSGYKINETCNKDYFTQNNDSNNDISNRRSWILKKILTFSSSCSLDEITQTLNISYETLEKDFILIKKQLHNYDLALKIKNNEISVVGSNSNKREMILDLIYDEMSESISDVSSIQMFFSTVNIAKLKDIIQKILISHNYYIDDFSLMNVVLWYAVCIEQKYPNINNHIKKLDYKLTDNAHIKLIIDEINQSIDEAYPIHLSEEDLYNLFILISTRISKQENFNYIISKDIQDLINEICFKVKQIFNIDLIFTKEDIRFALHLQNTIERLKNNLTLHNPQLQHIKATRPFTYDIATCAASVIHSKYNLYINEDEIGYLAIHIGLNLEAQITMQSKIRAILIYPRYFSDNVNLSQQIKEIFDKDLLIVDVVSFSDEIIDFDSCDFIISTIPFTSLKKNVIFVKSNLDYEDILNISNQIKYQKRKQMKTIFQNQLSSLICEDLYCFNPKYEDYNDAINKMCESMIKLGVVDSDFKDEVFEKEKLSSSVIGNIAIPHPIAYSAKKTSIVVSVLPKGIKNSNSDNKINLMLVLAINDNDKVLFKDIFKLITDFIIHPENLSLLMSAKTCNQFKNLIASFFESNL